MRIGCAQHCRGVGGSPSAAVNIAELTPDVTQESSRMLLHDPGGASSTTSYTGKGSTRAIVPLRPSGEDLDGSSLWHSYCTTSASPRGWG